MCVKKKKIKNLLFLSHLILAAFDFKYSSIKFIYLFEWVMKSWNSQNQYIASFLFPFLGHIQYIIFSDCARCFYFVFHLISSSYTAVLWNQWRALNRKYNPCAGRSFIISKIKITSEQKNIGWSGCGVKMRELYKHFIKVRAVDIY